MIQEHEWLHTAKLLAVGMRVRRRHAGERRENLIIGNDADKYWCYCHACHEGHTVEKTHVKLQEVAPSTSCSIEVPKDIRPVLGSEHEYAVARFLATKNMDAVYLPPMYYSKERMRLMFWEHGQYFGRDLTGKSMQKWMSYGKARFAGEFKDTCVVTEDLFSMYKVRSALNSWGVGVLCNLGTASTTELSFALLHHNVKRVLWFFDADEAGDEGAARCIRRLKAFSIEQARVRPPDGLDPKDMQCWDIRNLLTPWR